MTLSMSSLVGGSPIRKKRCSTIPASASIIGVNSVVYHDGMVQGRTLDSVLPTYVVPAS